MWPMDPKPSLTRVFFGLHCEKHKKGKRPSSFQLVLSLEDITRHDGVMVHKLMRAGVNEGARRRKEEYLAHTQ